MLFHINYYIKYKKNFLKHIDHVSYLSDLLRQSAQCNLIKTKVLSDPVSLQFAAKKLLIHYFAVQLTLSWTAHSQSGLHVLSQHHICPRILRPVPSSETKLGHPWQHR